MTMNPIVENELAGSAGVHAAQQRSNPRFGADVLTGIYSVSKKKESDRRNVFLEMGNMG